MIKEALDSEGRFDDVTVIAQELAQLVRLLPFNLPPTELAFRLGVSLNQTKLMLRFLREFKHDTPLNMSEDALALVSRPSPAPSPRRRRKRMA